MMAQSPAKAEGVTPFTTEAKHAVLIEAATGDVLFEKDADAPMPTSSMSKVMTMYLVFEAINDGRLKLDDEMAVSARAWKQEGSRTFLNVGQNVKVTDLIRGVIVQSGNDAAVALAERLGGSEEQFAAMMNAKAAQLGMKQSHFVNATGLPHPEHMASASDLAILGLATLRDFPGDYHYYSEENFTFNNIKQGNRNPLLYRNIGVDGLKTGHAEDAGFGMIGSAVRAGRRLLFVVNGLPNMQARADESAKILEWGYREYALYPLLKKAMKMADANVWLGTAPSVPLVAEKDLALSLPRSTRAGLRMVVSFNQPVPAPVAKGQVLGKVTVNVPGKEMLEVPLVAGEDVGLLGFWDRIMAKLNYLTHKAK
jgi:serine-type D-Ala-D-Ala carboxypeptidase (penicillin-binding protein 5/6)